MTNGTFLRSNPPLRTMQPDPTTTSNDSLTLEDTKRVTLPSPAWSMQVPSSSDHLLISVKVQEQSSSAQPLAISHTVAVHSNLTWTITVHGHLVTQEQCSAIFNMPTVVSTDDLAQLLAQLDQLRVALDTLIHTLLLWQMPGKANSLLHQVILQHTWTRTVL